MLPVKPTVTFYCKPYVKHWLEWQFGKQVELPRRSNLLKLVLNCLSKKYFRSGEYDLKQYPAKVEITVSQHDLTIYGNCISLQLQHNLNNLFESEIKTYLHTYIYAHKLRGVTIGKAILLFQTQFGFADEIFPAETIRTAYFRREQELNNIFSGTDTKLKRYATAKPN